MYRVCLAPVVAKVVSSIHPDIRRMLKTGMLELAANPNIGKELLDDLAGFRSHRVKRYRIVSSIDVEHHLIKVYMIGHRRDIYDIVAALRAAERKEPI